MKKKKDKRKTERKKDLDTESKWKRETDAIDSICDILKGVNDSGKKYDKDLEASKFNVLH